MSADPDAAVRDATESEPERSLFADRDLSEYLQGGALAVAVLFALVSAVGFYTSTRRAIDVWVASAYQPAFDAGFNLVVLLVALAAASRLAERLE